MIKTNFYGIVTRKEGERRALAAIALQEGHERLKELEANNIKKGET